MTSTYTPVLPDFQLAERTYPQLFQHLRAAGWYPARDVDPPSDEDALGFVPHDYAIAFLRSLNGIRVKVPVVRGTHTLYRGFPIGFGPELARMDPPNASTYIGRIAGTSFVYPVMASGDLVGFVLEDGRALVVDEAFRGCAWAPEPFAMMHWCLFKERLSGFDMRELRMDERPIDYRW